MLEELIHHDALPIASGRYVMVVKFWYIRGSRGYWNDYDDEDQLGFDCLKLTRIGDPEVIEG